MPVFTNGYKLGKYTVQSLIKANNYTETYRAVDEEGTPFFLKTFIIKNVPQKIVNSDTGEILEIEHIQKLQHKNIISFVEHGSEETEQGLVQYYITNYFNGELLIERVQRQGRLSEEEAVNIYRAMLEGLDYMHGLGLMHNDITPRNVMLSSVSGTEPQIIDFGHISAPCRGIVPFDVNDLEFYYLANETFSGNYDTGSDVFSATAVLYTMLTGETPWESSDFPTSGSRSLKAMWLKDHRKNEPLNIDGLNVSANIYKVLKEVLVDSERIISAARVLRILDRQPSTDESASEAKPSDSSSSSSRPSSSPRRPRRDDDKNKKNYNNNNDDLNHVEFDIKRGGGNGFADIAGMHELKEYLTQKIIFALKNKEVAQRYRIHAPNAMLLWGPPGCGKTFVAEKFAEETGFSYVLVKSSDLASSYVHGSQQKIAALFKQAEAEAPIVICFDEFDALVPNRSLLTSEHLSGEVNEFLSQLNNCSERDIFVVATTNRPDRIDPAVLRTGRIDKRVYVPLPDVEARKEMFAIHMKDRPGHENIDYDKLASDTEGYISSDIEYIVNDAALVAAFTSQDITQNLLMDAIHNTRPSLHPEIIKEYDSLRDNMENMNRSSVTRRRVGF